jgi:hypothetical protein
MQAGLVYIAGTAGKMVVTSAISPVVQSTVSLITSLRTSTSIAVTLQEVIQKRDITCTLQTIEATMIALKCDKEPLKTAAGHVVEQIHQIHQLLTKIADITAGHNAGYISRWRQLYLDQEIAQLENFMDILGKRFKLLCDIRSVVNVANH